MNDPVPCDTDRRSIEYLVISSSGTSARICVRPMPTGIVPITRPRLPDRSDMTAPTYSSGTRMDTSSTGSSSIGDAFSQASRRAARPAFWNAMSEESTGCALPSNSVTRTPVIGYPASTPASIWERTPFSTDGMNCLGTTPPTILSTNSNPAAPDGSGSTSMWQIPNSP